MLERFGQAVQPAAIKVENIAAVMVTAQLGPYVEMGARLDVTAASVGDALQPAGRHSDADAAPRARWFARPACAGAAHARWVWRRRRPEQRPGQPSDGRQGLRPADSCRCCTRPAWVQPNGCSWRFANLTSLARRVAAALDQELGAGVARVLDAGAVSIEVPAQDRGGIPDSSHSAESSRFRFRVDVAARVVVNERTGTGAGGNVRLGSRCPWLDGRLSVRIATEYQVSQPAPFSGGKTEVVPHNLTSRQQDSQAQMVNLEQGATLADVVRALNMLGATSRDIISITQSLKAVGASS